MEALQEFYRVFMTQHLWFLHDLLVDYGIFLCISLGCYLTLMSGQISIGHGALASVGAYLTAILTVNLGFPVWLSMLLAGFAGAALGLIVALTIALRLEGMYLAIATFAVGEILVVTWRNVEYVGGALGFLRIPLATTIWHVVIVVGAVTYLLWRFERSHLGRAFRATFHDEWTAMAMGVDVERVKIYAWTLGGFITGIGGALYAHNLGVLRPVNFAFDYAVMILLAPTLGGYYTFWGTYIGAAVIIFAPWILNVTDPNYKRLGFAALFVIIMVFRPQGIIGWQGSRMPAVLKLLFRDRALETRKDDREIVAAWSEERPARRPPPAPVTTERRLR